MFFIIRTSRLISLLDLRIVGGKIRLNAELGCHNVLRSSFRRCDSRLCQAELVANNLVRQIVETEALKSGTENLVKDLL